MFYERQSAEQIVERRVLRDSIKKYLTDLILSGTLRPGDRVIETKIAKTLNVSQSPVREAIRDLEQIGLIETKPFQGAYVKKLTRKGLAEAYEVRSMMEAVAAREAARRITADDLNCLRGLYQEITTAANNNERQKYIEKDIAFHETIFQIAGNELLYKLWQSVCLSSFTFIGTNHSRRSLPDLARRHEAILTSLAKRDADLAEKEARLHIDEMAGEIMRDFPD